MDPVRFATLAPETAVTPVPACAALGGRRGVVRALSAAGMAMLAALGFGNAGAAKGKARHGKGAGKRKPAGNDQPRHRGAGDAAGGPSTEAVLFSGGFLGITTVTKEITVAAFSSDTVFAACPAAAPGERVVLTGGGPFFQVLDGAGFMVAVSGPADGNDPRWRVTGVNNAAGENILGAQALCARFKR
jgi:hypothetical protein